MGKEMDIMQRLKFESGPVVFERFADELEAYTQMGTIPPLAGQDVIDSLQLQADRLKKMDLEMYYEKKRRWPDSQLMLARKCWEGEEYHNEMQAYSYRIRTSVLEKGQTVYRRAGNKMLCEVLTYARNREKALENGESYPVITNFYFLQDVTGKLRDFDTEVRKYVKVCGAAVGVFFFFKCLEVGPFLAAAIWGVLMGMVSGVPAGYTVYGIFGLIRRLIKAVKSLIKGKGPVKRREYFMNVMEEEKPEFAFEYFTSKVIFLLRMILFSEDPTKLPFYKGEALPEAAGLIETTYQGVLEIKSCKVEDGIMHMTVEILMKDLYYLEKKVREKRNRFQLELVRKLSESVDYNFTMRKLKCQGCGKSFDAMKQKACPFCGTAYEAQNSDWVVNSCIMIK